MRTFLLVVALAALLPFALSPAAAAPAICKETGADATFVKVTVGYGVGVGCVHGEVERCVLRWHPEYPSHPYWQCSRVIALP